ncbi:MAG TPA: putative quinol monooxygenase [Solirubrobacteraceae bacterium]|jgi:quinol monooxygenase YgiN
MAYCIAVRWTVKEGELDASLAALGPLVAASRAEPGCLLYQAHRMPDDPNVIFLYEQYADKEAYQAHADSDHFKRYAVGGLFPRREAADRAEYETFEP